MDAAKACRHNYRWYSGRIWALQIPFEGNGQFLLHLIKACWQTVAFLVQSKHARCTSIIFAAALQDKKQGGKLGAGEAPVDATEVTATFTANVWEVLVKPGDEVEEGQTLVILEAMKMEYPMTAPHAGKVFEVMANASELAQQGDVLLTLGKTDAPAGSAQRKEE